MGTRGRAVSPAAGGRPALLMDLGGVVVEDKLPAAAAKWAARLGIGEDDFVTSVYAGNDTEVLVGRMDGPQWWSVVRDRLGLDAQAVTELRADLAADPVYDRALLDAVAALRARAATAFVSNAWPDARPNLGAVLPAAEVAVLSCEVGYAKPDPRIYTHTLRLLGAEASEALFVDDVAQNVEAARALGMAVHLHTDSAGTLAALDAFASRLPRATGPGTDGTE
ncbi:HAD family hydrolase [Streptomyces reniochalinae]|uniref:HAD family hydrolase n=1 Tax=Streptomyces reniochalinae TaxID=2250578 RepID=A0A367F0E7_9ACTN|nr:HAD family hydrolase [Streptomyces reniochalinae]